jgi:NAD(P)-dependent dehydrogenase (short-subunit alcohol dehydrogenase family)
LSRNENRGAAAVERLIAESGNSNDNKPATDDGFDITFGVNHLGHFLLTNLLLPLMDDNGRIVFVASDMHNPPFYVAEILRDIAMNLRSNTLLQHFQVENMILTTTLP